MKSLLQKISYCFAAGVVGALANSLLVWAFGQLGIPKAVGVRMAPAFTLTWLYPRLVWGGIWAQLFLLPIGRSAGAAVLVSLVPSAATLLFFMPQQGKAAGYLGLGMGTLAPLFVVFYNAVWGLVAAGWLGTVEGKKG